MKMNSEAKQEQRSEAQTVTAFSRTDTYLITVASTGGIGPNDLKDLIQKKFKVLDIVTHRC